MAFPYPTAVDAVLGGQEVWRLYSQITSVGEIFEAEVSGSVFCLGPNSDVSNILVTYFRQDVNNQSETIEIDTERPHVGRLDALASQVYGTGQKARLLITPNDNVFSNIIPEGYDDETDRLVEEPIFIDFMQYLSPPPAVFSRRSDRTYFYQSVPFFNSAPATPSTVFYIIPYYGRRYADVVIETNEPVAIVSIVVNGVILNPGTSGPSLGGDLLTVAMLASTALVVDVARSFRFTDVGHGMYDLLLVQVSVSDASIASPTRTFFRVRTSDNAVGT